MTKLLLFSAFFLGLNSQAQTKLVSYKSHSGDIKNIAREDLASLDGNLGIAPERMITSARLDSVLILDEHKSVIVTSRVCKSRITDKSSKWKPGRDTVTDSRVFQMKNLDSMKSVLRSDYFFKNDMDSVVFMKYDARKKKFKNVTPKTKMKDKSKSSKMNYGVAFGLLLISGAAGWWGVRKK